MPGEEFMMPLQRLEERVHETEQTPDTPNPPQRPGCGRQRRTHTPPRPPGQSFLVGVQRGSPGEAFLADALRVGLLTEICSKLPTLSANHIKWGI